MVEVEQVKKKRRGVRKRQSNGSAGASKFMSFVPDNLLLEIFTRLPDFRSVIQCGSVCKRWYSLLTIDSQYFIRIFNHHHRHKRQRQLLASPLNKKRQLLAPPPNNNTNTSSSPPYTLLFRGGYPAKVGILPPHILKNHPSFDYFSEKSNILHGNRYQQTSSFLSTTSYLDFMADWPRAFIWSWFEDLLLVQRSETQFYVCNPLTRQLVALPRSPSTYQWRRAGFVCQPNSIDCNKQEGEEDRIQGYYCNCSIKYAVVLISFHEGESHAAIFRSETGEWKESSFVFRFPTAAMGLWRWHNLSVGSVNRIMYWQLADQLN